MLAGPAALTTTSRLRKSSSPFLVSWFPISAPSNTTFRFWFPDPGLLCVPSGFLILGFSFPCAQRRGHRVGAWHTSFMVSTHICPFCFSSLLSLSPFVFPFNLPSHLTSHFSFVLENFLGYVVPQAHNCSGRENNLRTLGSEIAKTTMGNTNLVALRL